MAPKGLLFDVFGTLVDWRSSISRQVRELLAAGGIEVPWQAFADAWRAEYQPALEEVRSGRRPFLPLDDIHRETLEKVLHAFRIDVRDDRLKEKISRAWHHLDAWPDVREGLARLRKRFLIAPCSNANVSLLSDLARHNGWEWDGILGAELAQDYKPKPDVYRRSVSELGCLPAEVVMVAAHPLDLQAAQAVGMKTAFIPRPLEYGNGRAEDAQGLQFDWTTASLTELADQLGCGA